MHKFKEAFLASRAGDTIFFLGNLHLYPMPGLNTFGNPFFRLLIEFLWRGSCVYIVTQPVPTQSCFRGLNLQCAGSCTIYGYGACTIIKYDSKKAKLVTCEF